MDSAVGFFTGNVCHVSPTRATISTLSPADPDFNSWKLGPLACNGPVAKTLNWAHLVTFTSIVASEKSVFSLQQPSDSHRSPNSLDGDGYRKLNSDTFSIVDYLHIKVALLLKSQNCIQHFGIESSLNLMYKLFFLLFFAMH